jgi:hypothetical protein
MIPKYMTVGAYVTVKFGAGEPRGIITERDGHGVRVLWMDNGVRRETHIHKSVIRRDLREAN